MAAVEGLRVLVEGDLPEDVLARVGAAVRSAALAAVAELDLAPRLREVPLQSEDFAPDRTGEKADPRAPSDEPAFDEAELPIELIPILLGIWFKQASEV